ncbi:MAG: histidinol-phosphate transaminase [Gammaproteobacteria bacterium]|jgi:histidinol-phosphate aminotransferase|nr:histidinol-phosphate transaminase [Gammaproteobacteria bacterium]MDP6615931.1 histidinol-phosphate transaminase [Gammaproteobacteria bacterium]MDP6695030.1 histidinol-phosphate transaminase [Gammaproteobacteria bacterium]MDP7041775.1 histidinol-phosphate transaminase [Gammaproteobacteria bacterium]
MSSAIELARPEVRQLVPYSAASYADGLVRLNANETPWPAPVSNADLNRYPPEKPELLTRQLAEYYSMPPDGVLVTRGSSEAIDLLIRAFCAAGQDAIVTCPPTFGMYRVYADVQGARVNEIPLRADQGYALDADQITRNWPDDGKLLFICSPNNPTGNRFDTDELNLICNLLGGRALVVIDAAYTEFADEDPTLELLEANDNVVVLRTLSKAFGLAGARCGVLLGPADVVGMLSCIMPPYALSTPCIDAVLACLGPDAQAEVQTRVELLRGERTRLAAALEALSGIDTVYPSDANFLLVRAADAKRCCELAKNGGVLIRNFGWEPGLEGCLRITVGTKDENDRLLKSLAEL